MTERKHISHRSDDEDFDFVKRGQYVHIDVVDGDIDCCILAELEDETFFAAAMHACGLDYSGRPECGPVFRMHFSLREVFEGCRGIHEMYARPGVIASTGKQPLSALRAELQRLIGEIDALQFEDGGGVA